MKKAEPALCLFKVNLFPLKVTVVTHLCPFCEAADAGNEELTGDNVDPAYVVKQCIMCEGYYFWDREDGGEEDV